jgi:hypothetical protein
LLTFLSAFLSAFLSELIGEGHGFGLKGFASDLADPFLEQGDVRIGVENIAQYTLQRTL